MGSIDGMINYAVQIANDDSHGYSQVHRWPSQGNDFDCSSLMYCAAQIGGQYKISNGYTNCSGYTGSMINDFTNGGFTWVPWSQVGEIPRGAILLNKTCHTELYIGNDQNVGAHIDEFGGITGPSQGDQTRQEISITPYYVYSVGWDGILVPPNDDASSLNDLPTITAPEENVTINKLAREVIAGIHGNGERRKESLGDLYDEVQAEVNRLLLHNPANTAPVELPDESYGFPKVVTCKRATIWRERPSTNASIFATYYPGAQVKCIGFVSGEDPYNDGRCLWYQSSANKKFCWQGTIEGV